MLFWNKELGGLVNSDCIFIFGGTVSLIAFLYQKVGNAVKLTEWSGIFLVSIYRRSSICYKPPCLSGDCWLRSLQKNPLTALTCGCFFPVLLGWAVRKNSAACFCRKCPLIIQLIMRNLERGNLPKENPPTFSHHCLNIALALTRICIHDGILEWVFNEAEWSDEEGKAISLSTINSRGGERQRERWKNMQSFKESEVKVLDGDL